jgi:hypothetical protein
VQHRARSGAQWSWNPTATSGDSAAIGTVVALQMLMAETTPTPEWWDGRTDAHGNPRTSEASLFTPASPLGSPRELPAPSRPPRTSSDASASSSAVDAVTAPSPPLIATSVRDEALRREEMNMEQMFAGMIHWAPFGSSTQDSAAASGAGRERRNSEGPDLGLYVRRPPALCRRRLLAHALARALARALFARTRSRAPPPLAPPPA